MTIATNRSRCIIVLSLPRSGSSLVAGCLHRLGVDMGEGHLQHADKSNPTGYYEDMRWHQINKFLAGSRYTAQRVWTLPVRQRAEYEALAAECAKKPLWGAKAPRFAHVFQHVWPIIAKVAEIRVVVVNRDRSAVISSLMQHSRTAYGGALVMSRAKAAQLLVKWNAALVSGLEGFDGPVLEVGYEALMSDPETEIAILQGYALPHGSSESYARQWQNAVAFAGGSETLSQRKENKFLSIVTRTHKRPKRLEQCKASIAQLTDADYEHVIVRDEIGVGHDGAYQLTIDAFDAGRFHGRYAWFLDDDDRLADPAFVTRLKETVATHDNPPVIVVRHQNAQRIWPEDAYWERPPVRRHIGIGCLIVRADVWRKYAPFLTTHHYAGDWMMITQMVKDGLHREWVWLDMIGTLKGPAGVALPEDQLDTRGLVFVNPQGSQ